MTTTDPRQEVRRPLNGIALGFVAILSLVLFGLAWITIDEIAMSAFFDKKQPKKGETPWATR